MKSTRKIVRKLRKYIKKQNVYKTNDKLYDIAYIIEDKDISLFNDFCYTHWSLFCEYLNELDIKILSIGRTSTFYLVPEKYKNCFNDHSYEGFDEIQCGDVKFNLYEWYSENVGGDLDEDIQDEKHNKEIFKENAKYLKKEIKDLKDAMKDVKLAYEYLECFKNDQLSIWQEEININKEVV